MSSNTSILNQWIPNRSRHYGNILSDSGIYKIDYGIDIPVILLPFVEDFPHYKPIFKEFKQIRGLGKNAFDAFRESRGVTPVIIQEEMFYIGKGTIISPKGEFLIVTTVNIPNSQSLILMKDRSSMREVNPKVYINRRLFSESFREEYRNLYNRIHNKIIPELADTEFDFTIKRDLDFSIKTTTDNTKDIKELNEFFKPFIDDFQILNIV